MYRLVYNVIQLTLVIFFSTIVYAQTKPEAKIDNKPDSYYLKQFQEAFERIQRDYIHVPNRQEMTDEAINGMLSSLDPYSGYFTDDDLEFFINQTDGEFGGIGVEIIYDSGAIKIITPIDDLPAYKAGIRAGDYIVGVNGQLVSNLGFNKAVKEMRGTPGTKLNLLIVKSEENITKEIELTREIVKIKPIKYEIEENDDTSSISYIRVSAFNNQTTSELKKAISEIESNLQKKNKKLLGIILDLRNNPGGLLDQAVAMGEYFLEQGTIVSVHGRDGKNDSSVSAGRFAPKAPNVPIVVLINAGTASAAEIVAGALQDHKRAIIMGTTSFGKGLVQSFTQINPRAAIKITTAKYYTPSGRSINAKGIKPDIYIEEAKVEFAEKENKDNKAFTSSSIKSYLKKYNTEEKNTDEKAEEKPVKDKNDIKTEEEKQAMSDRYKTDYQYARAYDLIRGLIVNSMHKK